MVKMIINEEDFRKLINKPIALIHFKSHGCSVCTAISKQLPARLKEYPELPIGEIYADDFPQLRGEYLIFTAPVIILFVDGKEVFRSARFIDFQKLSKHLDGYFQNTPYPIWDGKGIFG